MACGASCWRWEVARQLSRVQWTTAITQSPGTRLVEGPSGGCVRTRQGISRRLAAHDSPLEMELLVGLVVSVTQRGAASLQSEWMYLDVYHTARRETSHGAPRETLHHTMSLLPSGVQNTQHWSTSAFQHRGTRRYPAHAPGWTAAPRGARTPTRSTRFHRGHCAVAACRWRSNQPTAGPTGSGNGRGGTARHRPTRWVSFEDCVLGHTVPTYRAP